jgi:hypothetical protein
VQNLEISAKLLDNRVQESSRLLEEWEEIGGSFEALIYPLNYQYTNDGLCLKRLKAEELYRASHIDRTCANRGGSRVLLANMEYCKTDQQTEEDQVVTKLYSTRVVDLDGSVLPIHKNLNVWRGLILASDVYANRDPDIQRGGGYMGNEHAEIDRIFKDSVSKCTCPGSDIADHVVGHIDPACSTGHTLPAGEAFIDRRARASDGHVQI